jgi:sigma-B regulation protein RsbU (phosphoserine phosphatase)
MALMLASGTGPEQALTLAARTFADEVGRFATVAVVCVDPITGALRWANGGHHPPLLLAADGGQRELAPTGPLLSWLGGPWRVDATTMRSDEVLIAFSDGLVESHNEAREELEAHGLVELFQSARTDGATPDEAVHRTLAQARSRAVDWERDDVTLVVLSLTEPADSPTIPTPRPTPAPVR